jgi:hypothetical protein
MDRQPPATGLDEDECGGVPLDTEDVAAAPLDLQTVRMIRKSLDDPRPSIPAEEAFARVDARIAAYKAKHGL